MVALKIEDMKAFTAKLFVGDTFDHLLVREAVIVTYNVFKIDGRIRQGYYTDEELEQNRIEEFSSWKTIRPIAFSLIKGKKLPGNFQITLQLAPDGIEHFLEQRRLNIKTEDVGGIYINIRYEEGALYCVSGTSLNVFTMDKTLEMEWDEQLRILLKQNGIAFIE